MGCHIEEAIVKGWLVTLTWVLGPLASVGRCAWVLVNVVGMLLGFLEGW